MATANTQRGGPTDGFSAAASSQKGRATMSPVVMEYLVIDTQQELARSRGQRAWRTLFRR